LILGVWVVRVGGGICVKVWMGVARFLLYSYVENDSLGIVRRV